MCVDMCIGRCVDMCVEMSADMCVGMCADICVDMCAGMYVDMCVDECIGMCNDKSVLTDVLTFAWKCVLRCALGLSTSLALVKTSSNCSGAWYLRGSARPARADTPHANSLAAQARTDRFPVR